ncbi:MAG: hypothetical protein JXA36_06730 [Coriobacteriia bacterium]|nr:hypothetical protein [Coriobacteriia bacterium]
MSQTVDSESNEAVETAPQGPEARPRRPVVRVVGWTLALVALVGLVTAGVIGLRSMNRVRNAEDAIASASTLLEGAEEDLLIVDEAVQVEISSTVATQSVEAAELAVTVREDALAASEILADAMADLPEEIVPLAQALKESADARAEMMEIAPVILEADRQAAEAIPYADQAVIEIKGAEELSTQAVAEFNKHTSAGVKASGDYLAQAEAKLGVAQSLLTSATASFPGADYAAFGSYVEAKVGLIAMAKEIDALWLAGKVAESNTKLDAYNQRDAEIVVMAQALPASVRDPIADAYTAATTDASARYFEARERARAAGERVSELREADGEPD